MPRFRPGERAAYWRGVVRRQAASGASAPSFCARERLSLATFYVWRRRLHKAGGQGSSTSHVGRRRLRSRDDGPSASRLSTSPSALLPVRLVSDAVTSRCLEVQWPSGVVLRVPPGSDEATLRMVIEAVLGNVAEQPSC